MCEDGKILRLADGGIIDLSQNPTTITVDTIPEQGAVVAETLVFVNGGLTRDMGFERTIED